MSCPHQELFSCEDCIRDAIREDVAKNGHPKPIFERYRDAQAEIQKLRTERDDLRALLTKIFPSLPSYLGASETEDNPCLRRLADEALK